MEKKDLLESVFHLKQYDFVRGEGTWLFDREGNRYLDLNEMCVFLGQGNQHFIDRVTQALNGVTNGRSNLVRYKEQLTDYLMESTGHIFKAVHYTASGSETTEWAVRLAKKITGRTEVVSFWNSIHGRTFLSASMSGLPKRKEHYGPIAPGIVFNPYPHCQHCPFEKRPESCGYFCLDFLQQKIRYESAQDIAAVIIEPYQGADVAYPPQGYLQRLRQWTQENGILLIFDEIQTGLGRSGSLYCYQKEGVEPDMLLLGKGLGNGLHISALLTKQIPQEEYLHAVTGGAGDDCIACAAACAVMEEVTQPQTLQRVRDCSQLLQQELEELQRQGKVSYVRVYGSSVAIEFASPQVGRQVRQKMQEKRFLFGGSDSSIVLKPPLCLTVEQAKLFTDALKESL